MAPLPTYHFALLLRRSGLPRRARGERFRWEMDLKKEGFIINIFNLCVNLHARESTLWVNRSLSLDRCLESWIPHRRS